MRVEESYPNWVCFDCASNAGGKPSAGVSCFHMAICPCCGKNKPVTEPRNYRYPKLVAKYEYKAVEPISGAGSAERDIGPEGEAEQSAQGDISEVRPTSQGTDRPESGDYDVARDGIKPCDGILRAEGGISVTSDDGIHIRVDYLWICEQISKRLKYTECCGKAYVGLHSLIDAFRQLHKEQK